MRRQATTGPAARSPLPMAMRKSSDGGIPRSMISRSGALTWSNLSMRRPISTCSGCRNERAACLSARSESRIVKPHFVRRSLPALGAILFLAFCPHFAPSSGAAALSEPRHGLSLRVDEATGVYEVAAKDPAWTLGGSIGGPVKDVAVSRGSDAIGAYQQMTFSWSEAQTPVTGRIRLYDESALVLFASQYGVALDTPPAPFPCFTQIGR